MLTPISFDCAKAVILVQKSVEDPVGAVYMFELAQDTTSGYNLLFGDKSTVRYSY